MLLQNEKRQSQDSFQGINHILTSLIELNKVEYPEMQTILAEFKSLEKKNIMNTTETVTFFRNIFLKIEF